MPLSHGFHNFKCGRQCRLYCLPRGGTVVFGGLPKCEWKADEFEPVTEVIRWMVNCIQTCCTAVPDRGRFARYGVSQFIRCLGSRPFEEPSKARLYFRIFSNILYKTSGAALHCPFRVAHFYGPEFVLYWPQQRLPPALDQCVGRYTE